MIENSGQYLGPPFSGGPLVFDLRTFHLTCCLLGVLEVRGSRSLL